MTLILSPGNGFYSEFASHLQTSLPRYLESGKHSDLIVTCEGETHKVHKVVMCAHSTWFAKACEGGFKEAQTGEVKLEDDDPMLVKAMIEAIYRGDYYRGDYYRGDYPCGNKNVPSVSLEFHARVYALADKYDIPSLSKLATDKFESGCKYFPEPHHFACAIEELYSSTLSSDRGLRDIAVRTAVHYSGALFDDVDFCDMVELVREFMLEVVKAPVDDKKRAKHLKYTCQHCTNKFYRDKLNSLRQVWCPSCGDQSASKVI